MWLRIHKLTVSVGLPGRSSAKKSSTTRSSAAPSTWISLSDTGLASSGAAITFVVYFAHQFFQQVFKCHDTPHRTVFVDDNGTVQFFAPQLGKQFIDILVLRDKKRLVGDLVKPRCLRSLATASSRSRR